MNLNFLSQFTQVTKTTREYGILNHWETEI